jgi:Leu/Phe-tRNA-protein transferase
LEKKSSVSYLSFDDIKDKNILFNHIYANEKSNFYISDDLSKDFYINQALCGFISTSVTIEDKFYLVPEMQFEYAILDFENLHISKKVQKLINKSEYEFSINTNLNLVLENIEKFHKNNWLNSKYKELMLSLKDYIHPTIDFKIFSIELYDKNTKELIAGEIGYKIDSTYTSLTGFSSNEKNYNNWGKLQLVLLGKYLEKENFSFWNLGHPYMQYKFDLGAVTYKRKDFLSRWLEKVSK